jgi:hypothetical protein
MDNREYLTQRLIDDLGNIIKLTNIYNVLRHLTYDLANKRKDRQQIQKEVYEDIDVDFVYNLQDTTDLNYFIGVAYWDLRQLTHENGFETPDEEIEFLIRCFEGKERCGLKERDEAIKEFEELKRKNWYFHNKLL